MGSLSEATGYGIQVYRMIQITKGFPSRDVASISPIRQCPMNIHLPRSEYSGVWMLTIAPGMLSNVIMRVTFEFPAASVINFWEWGGVQNVRVRRFTAPIAVASWRRWSCA